MKIILAQQLQIRIAEWIHVTLAINAKVKMKLYALITHYAFTQG